MFFLIMKKLFLTTWRNIIVSIEDDFVVFYFETNPDYSFYDFYKEDWESTSHEHIKSKPWYTKEISDWITSNIES